MPRHESVFCRGWNAAVFFLSSWFRDLFIGVSRFWSFPRWNDYGGGIQIRSTMHVFLFLFSFSSFSFFFSFSFFAPSFLFALSSPYFPPCVPVVHAKVLYSRFVVFSLIFALNDACEEKRARQATAFWQTLATKGFRGRNGWLWSILKLALRKNGSSSSSFSFFLFL